MDLGRNLKRFREEQQYTQGELADAMGIERTVIVRIEMGYRFPSVPQLVEIADILNCPLDDLVGRKVG